MKDGDWGNVQRGSNGVVQGSPYGEAVGDGGSGDEWERKRRRSCAARAGERGRLEKSGAVREKAGTGHRVHTAATLCTLYHALPAINFAALHALGRRR